MTTTPNPAPVTTTAEDAQEVAADLCKLIDSAPAHIWLDLGESLEALTDEGTFRDLREVSWSEENATGVGIKYVRAPVAVATSDAERAALLPSDEQVITAARAASPAPISDDQIATHLSTWRMFAAALPARSVWAGIDLHPETGDLVERFARALAEKLAAAEKKYGYSNGWKQSGWMDECRTKLLEHIEKGDPRDVAAYCAFLWHHGEPTAARAALPIDFKQATDQGGWQPIATAKIHTFDSGKVGVLWNPDRDPPADGTHLYETPIPLVASGWQLVPTEPTPEMIAAAGGTPGMRAIDSASSMHQLRGNPLPAEAFAEGSPMHQAYRAMLAAAPALLGVADGDAVGGKSGGAA